MRFCWMLRSGKNDSALRLTCPARAPRMDGSKRTNWPLECSSGRTNGLRIRLLRGCCGVGLRRHLRRLLRLIPTHDGKVAGAGADSQRAHAFGFRLDLDAPEARLGHRLGGAVAQRV